jgi:hypothetical protein
MGKTPCTNCGALVLPATAERNNGLCAKCKQSMPRPKIGVGIGIFLAVLGTILLVLGIAIVGKRTEAKETWPTANGTIVKIEEGEIRTTSKRDSRHRQHCSDFHYSYAAGDQTYASHFRATWEENIDVGSSEAYVKQLMETYKKGNPVLVYYNPDDHDDAFAEPEFVGLSSNIWKYGMQTFGGLFILLGILRAIKSAQLATQLKRDANK